jgi:hypothetical protein
MGEELTQSKRWPNNCDWARMDCITLSREGQRQLAEINELISDPAIMRRVYKVIVIIRNIEIKLIEVKNGEEGTEASISP